MPLDLRIWEGGISTAIRKSGDLPYIVVLQPDGVCRVNGAFPCVTAILVVNIREYSNA
ncbi:hypothetical protein SPHINGOR109_10951 [Sphingorhabdus sp. 109]|jgi:hypothetical protein|nr:hypothetical protein SPHINGOR109_10951 [Sphingorhabdus sp. 109]